MRWMAVLLAVFTMAVTPAKAALILNVTLDHDQERDHAATQAVFNDLAGQLAGAPGQPIKPITARNAPQARRLMARGVPLFDLRPISRPCRINSPKEPDCDDSVDEFDLSRLPKDTHSPMIFQCNGPECWYSYEASRHAPRRGYDRIYGFRTGLSGWNTAGHPLVQGT
jgi:hypothetical protein